MRQFTLYLDDDVRLAVVQKLEEQGIEAKKGALAPLIRVMLKAYADDLIKVTPELIEQEYVYTTTKNKRSCM